MCITHFIVRRGDDKQQHVHASYNNIGRAAMFNYQNAKNRTDVHRFVLS